MVYESHRYGVLRARTHYESVQSDINTRRALQDELRFQALHDAVTELPNRRSLEQYLARDRTDLMAGNAAIGVINIDEFRAVNDRVGLRGGDELLRALGRRLRNLVGTGNFLASMNGDEFAVVVDGLSTPHSGSAHSGSAHGDDLDAILTRLHEAVERPFQVQGESVTVGISMGVALCPPGRDISACLRDADTALRAGKIRGPERSRWWYVAKPAAPTDSLPGTAFATAQTDRAMQNKRDEKQRTRLFNGGLVMHMQPIIDLRTGGLSRVEALARLVLLDGTVVGPDQFLPALDDGGHDELFRLGLDDALGHLVRWDTEGLSTRVSVNLSPSTLYHPDCATWVHNALRHHGIDPNRLTLELLETQSAKSAVQVASIHALLDLGVGLALDDLGSGHATLSRLAELPFDSIKLDRGLFSGFVSRPVETLSMLATLTQMGRDFKVDVVVEGLEEEALTEAAAVLGVPLGQGYFIARPMPAASIPGWVAAFHSPLVRGTVATALGALAYHWKFLRWDSPHPLPLPECPLTAFLLSNSTAAADPTERVQAIAWHEQQHRTFDARSTEGRQLQDWLVDVVQRQASAAREQDRGWGSRDPAAAGRDQPSRSR